MFSDKYDLTNLLLKILISIGYALETNKIVSDYSLIFLKISIIFIFILFNLCDIFEFFIKENTLPSKSQIQHMQNSAKLL
jgi:hypothetical protein